MEGPARMADQPGLDLGVLVGRVIVDDGVDQLAGGDRALDGVEEADELLMGVLLHAATEHRAVEHVEGGEQGGRAVALVIVRHGPALAGFERQARLGAVEGLYLGFFVDRQHDGVGRRVHVEADDVLDLLGEGGVVGALEGSQSMRLQPVRLPDALDRPQREAHGSGHGASGPMGRLSRRLGAGQRQHLGDGRQRHGSRARRPGLVVQEPVHAFLGVAPLPAPDRRAAHSGATRHFENRQPVGRVQHNAGALNVLERPASIPDDRGQALAFLGADNHSKRSEPCVQTRTPRLICESYVCVSALAPPSRPPAASFSRRIEGTSIRDVTRQCRHL